jgi:hypothetical protein
VKSRLALVSLRRVPWRLGVFASAVACIAAAESTPVPDPTIEGVAGMLGAKAGRVVLPADVRWEPSRGDVPDLVLGRRVLFLASDLPGGPRDVWRAAVRVTPDGHALDVSDTHNLTSTPLGDDHSLVVRGERAAYATLAFGQEQSISMLDLAGERSGSSGESPWIEEATRWLTNAEETGNGDGVGRVEVTLDQPALHVGLVLTDRALQVELEDSGGGRRQAVLDSDRGELSPSAIGMHAEVVRHLPKRFILWAVDTARAVPWIGPAPVAWLEEHVFAVKDELRRMAFKAHDADATETLADVGAQSSPAATQEAGALSPHSLQLDEQGHWPPADIRSIWKTVEPGEGAWQAPRMPWMKKAELEGVDPASVPAAMLRTFVRPDPDRPYTRVILVAMDMRQLDLEMEAGTEDPKPLTGGHGPGRIPRDPAVYTRVVAAYNGAFKTEHGNYGMMVHKRVLLPPQPNAATVVVLSDQRVGFGSWADSAQIGRIRGVDPGDIVSFRQNLDALVDQGEVNPLGRALWGYTLPGQGMQTERSGLCVTKDGHLIYAWGDDVSGTALGKAMKMGGCDYAMHLDMNPHHTGFIFAAIHDLKTKTYKSELLTPLMTVSPDRYIEYAPKDFFYMLLHDPTPPPVGGVAWRADGQEPPPAWAPSLWSLRLHDGSGEVDLFDFEAGRAAFRIRGGSKEPDAKTGATALHDLDDEDANKVIVAVGLGRATDKHPRGLATDGRLAYPLAALRDGASVAGELGVLVAGANGALSIVAAEELTSVSPHTDVAELPLVLDKGAVAMGAKRSGPIEARAALGTTASGRVIVARGTFASNAPLAEALLRAGCTRAVALDRGSHSPPFLHRAGSDTPPRARYEDCVLYALALPLAPRAFRFEADSTVAEAGRAR